MMSWKLPKLQTAKGTPERPLVVLVSSWIGGFRGGYKCALHVKQATWLWGLSRACNCRRFLRMWNRLAVIFLSIDCDILVDRENLQILPALKVPRLQALQST